MTRRGALFLRFLIVNIVGAALLFAAWRQGWLAIVLDTDATRISLVIALVFAIGLTMAGRHMWRLDQAETAGDPGLLGYGLNTAAAIRIRLAEELGAVRNIANSLVFLGMIGTVVGFVIALAAIDPAAAADSKRVAEMVAELVDGMGVALITTLVGAVLHLWLSLNYRLLAGAATRLLARAVDQEAA